MENVNPLPPDYYSFEIKGLSGKDMGIRNNSSFLGKLKQKYSTTKKHTPNPDTVRAQPDTRQAGCWQQCHSMVAASSCSDRCDSAEAVLLQNVQFPSKGLVAMWRNLVFLWNPVEKGATLVSQNLCFHFGKKCWALPPGWSNFRWDAVILSVTQWDSMGPQQKMTQQRKDGL